MRREELEAKTKQELFELARKHDIPRRSLLSKDGLIRALLKDASRGRRSPFAPRSVAPARPPLSKPAGRAAAPAAKAKPAPAAKGRPAPAAKGRPVPAAKAKPAPTAKGRPMPAAKAKPAPLVKERPAAGARRPAQRPVAPVAVSGRRRTAERATPGDRPRQARIAAETRRERSGPYGPEAETLHGGVQAPAGQVAGNGRPAPRAPFGAPLEMPERYGRDHAGLLVRDPYWLHAYWEVTGETLAAVERELGDDWHDHRRVLRVLSYAPDAAAAPADDDPAADRYDVELPPGSTSWYLNVGRPERAYRVIVGILTRRGRFRALVRTNDVCTPRDTYSTVTDEEWTTTPAAFRHLYEQGLAGMREGRSSAELGMLLRERLGADWSSGMLGSMGSGAMVRPSGQRGFWFVLDAELIVFGATEPDATVTMQGRPVALRPDGTFTLRFQLPDGTQVIDATAVSPDGVFRKTITPTVRRETHVTEMIANELES